MKKGLSVLIASVFALLSCRSSVAPRSPAVVLDVQKVDAPATITSSSPLDVVLSVVTGGCVTFDKVQSQRGVASLSLTAIGTDLRRDGCLDIAIVEPHTIRFEPPFAKGSLTIVVTRERLSPLIATVQVQ